jgi:hypothetical protein
MLRVHGPSLLAALMLGMLLSACPIDGNIPGGDNQPPGTPTVGIAPGSPTTVDDLSVTFLQEATDPDGDTLTYSYEWFVDNMPTEHAGSVPADATGRGETWMVYVRAVDPDGLEGEPATAEVTVVNTAPTAVILIEPDEPTSADDLVLTLTIEDADQDPTTTTVSWLLDGNPVAELADFTTVPAAETARDEVWTVQVVANDGDEDGPQATASVTVLNAPPTVADVVLAPTEPVEGDVLWLATGTPIDVDGDPVTLTYRWSVGGELVDDQEEATLSSDFFDKDDEIWAIVTPADDQELGAGVDSNHVNAVNTPPTGTSVSIDPASGTEETTFTCLPEGWWDPDPADSEGYLFQWYVDGVADVTTSTIDGASFDRDDVLHCEATPTDGEAEGTMLTSGTVTVSNTPPVVASATLSPSVAAETDTLTVTPSGFSDVDGDPEGYQYAWYVDGSLVGATSATLTGASFDKGDDVHCQVSPFDGTDAGGVVSTNTVSVVNSLPSLASVALTPTVLDTTIDVAAVPGGWSDADGDSPGYVHQWHVSGAPTGYDTDVLSSTFFVRGQTVYVELTPDDGEGQGAPVTSGTLTVVNAPPEPPDIEIQPEDPQEAEDLLCVETSVATDADSDGVTTTILWLQDGIPTAYSTAAVPGSATGSGEVWTCRVTPNDSIEDGEPAEVSVTVGCPWLFQDGDGDGFGDPAVTAQDCTWPSGWVDNDDDCDDTNGSVWPDAPETCGGIDYDCDGTPAPECPNQHSLEFDGSNDYVSIGAAPSVDTLTDQVTVEAWIWAIDNGSAFFNPIVTKQLRYSSNQDKGFRFEYATYSSESDLKFEIDTTSGEFVCSTGSAQVVTPQIWTHVAGVYDGATAKIYVDGVEVCSTGASGTIVPSPDPLEIGARSDNAGYRFVGNIDQVRIWGRVLSPAELADLAALGAPTDYTDLLGEWLFEEGSRATAGDTSGHGNDGTIMGGAPFSTDVPQ